MYRHQYYYASLKLFLLIAQIILRLRISGLCAIIKLFKY